MRLAVRRVSGGPRTCSANRIQEGPRTAVSARFSRKTCDARGQGCPRSFRAFLESPLNKPLSLWRPNESQPRPALKTHLVEDQELRLASELNRQNSVSQRRLVRKPKALNEQNKTLKWPCQVRVVRHVGRGARRMHNLRRAFARSHRVCVAAGRGAAASRGNAGGVSRCSDSNRK